MVNAQYSDPPAATAHRAADEQSLADLLEHVTQRLDAGEKVDIDELARAHPPHAARLQELMPTMVAMASWGRIAPGQADEKRSETNRSAITGVLGDFRILGELGRGGMGTVFEAEQISMGRKVALKVLPFAALAQPRALQRFRNEVRAAAALDHPHIVSVYSVGEERGIHYYSMQLIRGQSLAAVIQELREKQSPRTAELDKVHSREDDPTIDSAASGPQLTKRDVQAALSTVTDSRLQAERFRTAARLGIQAAEALQHAHEQGVLHRDIKPGNLMLDANGDVYVTDFGLARIEADAGMTMTGDIVGTLRYMAPEQALAKRVVIDHRADIYSLGATLYELLVLQPAFTETDRSDLLKQIAFEEPTALRKIDRQVPAELETIVLKAMAKNPAERYQAAQLLADDLRAFLEHRPIKAKPPTIVNRFAKWSRRHKPLVTSAALSMAALVLVSLGVLASSNVAIKRERDQKTDALAEKATALHDRTAALERAENNLQLVLAVIDRSVEGVGNQELAGIPQMERLRKRLLEDAIGFYEKLRGDNPADSALRFATARAYVRLATITFEFNNYEDANKLHNSAIELLDDLVRAEPGNQAYRFELATASKQQSWNYRADKIGFARRAVAAFQSLLDESPDNVSFREGLIDALRSQIECPDFAGERALCERMRQLIGPPEINKRVLAYAHVKFAALAQKGGRLDEAEANCRKAVLLLRQDFAEHPTDLRTREHLVRESNELGSLLVKRDKVQEAVAVYNEAFQVGNVLRRDFPAMRLFRSKTDNAVRGLVTNLHKLGQDEEAAERLREMAINDADDYSLRASLYTAIGQPDMAANDYQSAVDAWNLEISKNPTDTKTLSGRGKSFMQLKEFDKAIDDFSKARRLDPMSSDLFMTCLDAYLTLGRFDDATRLCREAVDQNAVALTKLHNHAINEYRNKQRYKEAIHLLTFVIGRKPDNIPSLRFRALTFSDLQRFDEALEDVNNAIRIAPQDASLFRTRGFIYMTMGEFEKALDANNEAVRLGPQEAAGYQNRGVTYLNLNRFDDALPDFSEAIRLAPQNSTHRQNRAFCYLQLNEVAKAVEDFDELVRLDPQNAGNLNELAWLLATASVGGVRDGQRAVELATLACEIGNYEDPQTLDTLAAACAEAGDFAAAIKWGEKAVELSKDDKLREELAEHLEFFRNEKPWRQPAPGGN